MINLPFRFFRATITSLFVLALATATLPAYASGDMSTTAIYRAAITESYIGSDNRFTLYATSDGREAFNYDLMKDGPESGTEFALTNEWDSGVQHILDAAASVNSETEFRPYITQAAIWWYRNPEDISSGFASDDKEAYVGFRNEIVMLVNEARAESIERPSKSDYFSSKIFTVTSDNSESFHSVKRDGITYFETPTVCVEWDGSAPIEFTSVLPAVDGVTVTELSDGSVRDGSWYFFGFGHESAKECISFRLRVPESLVDAFLQNPTVTFKCKTPVNSMQVYEAENQSTSRMVALSNDAEIANLEFSRTLDPTAWNAHEKVVPNVPFGIAITVGIALTISVVAIAIKVSSGRR